MKARYFSGYIVKYSNGSHLDFVATTYQALKDGLKLNKWPYKPTIYAVDAYLNKPKLRKLTGVQLKTVLSESGIK